MGKRPQRDQAPRKPRLAKETIRRLDARALSDDELAQVAGGNCLKPSTICTTLM